MKVTKYVLNVNFFSKVFQILGFSYNSNNNNDNHNNNNNNNNNNNTGEPPLSSNLLNGHPLLRGRLPKSGNNFDVILAFSTRVFPLSSPLLRGHQALYTLSLALFQEYDEGKIIQSEIEGDDRLWTSNVSPVACLF